MTRFLQPKFKPQGYSNYNDDLKKSLKVNLAEQKFSNWTTFFM